MRTLLQRFADGAVREQLDHVSGIEIVPPAAHAQGERTSTEVRNPRVRQTERPAHHADNPRVRDDESLSAGAEIRHVGERRSESSDERLV